MSNNKLQKNDFIEVDFTGKLKDTGNVFDSTVKEELQKLHHGHSHEIIAKPFIFSIGNGMFLPGVDEFLTGKEIGKDYTIELAPENAFGKRNTQMVKVVPLKHFTQQKINPQAGMSFNFDGNIGKILSVSGGRVTVDFNNPLSGKEIIYNIKILRKVDDVSQKVKSLNDFLFRQEFKFRIDEKNKKIIFELEEKQKSFQAFIELFKEKFKEIIGYDLELANSDIKEEKTPKEKPNKDKK